MRKYAIREVETVKTTAAVYGCECCPVLCGWIPPNWPTPILPDHCNQAF